MSAKHWIVTGLLLCTQAPGAAWAQAAATPPAAKPAPTPAAATTSGPSAAPTAPADGKATAAASVDKPGTKPAAAGAATDPNAAAVRVERTASGAKLFRFEGMLVEGQMQKPNAFYVLQRAAIDYDFEALSESFLPRILAATHEPPF